MPYENERVNMLGHVGIVSDDAIKQRLQSLDLGPQISIDGVASVDTHDATELEQHTLPNKAIAIDGSRAEPAIDQDNFTARVGFVEATTVEVDIAMLHEARGQATVPPTIIHDAMTASDTTFVLPGENAHFHGIPPKPRGWRFMLYQAFADESIRGVDLLDIYQRLLEAYDVKVGTNPSSNAGPVLDASGRIVLQNCPNPECPATRVTVPPQRKDRCRECGMDVYPTDRLRIHERVGNYRENLTAINIVMEVLVHLGLAASLQSVREDPSAELSEFVFMKDGPLAQFDTAAWIARAMLAYIEELRAEVNQMPPIIGLHKSGEFVVFANRLREESNDDDEESTFPEQTVVSLESQDIYEYVKSREREGMFGQKSYYGKNFVYRSESGYTFPVTIPRQMPTYDELCTEPDEYPTLGAALAAIDATELALYKDSVIPIHMAHDEATIPEKLGSKVLRELVEAEVLNANRVYGR